MSPSLTERLVPILRRPVGAEIRTHVTLHVLDWVGCAILGATTDAGAVFRAEARARAPGPAAVVGGGRVEGRAAAFANGAFGNILEMDDLHREAILHPGPVVIAAALAAAETTGASAERFLDAVVRGYEAMIRLGRALGPGHYRHFHPTGTCGPFGAAAAVGDLLGLDDGQLVSALGNAGTQAAGLWQCRHEPVMTKQLHNARAAEAGYAAALLASFGLTGARFILEGEQGLFAGMAPGARPDDVTSEPNGAWLVTQTSLKPWPACRHAHAAIDAALVLRQKRPEVLPVSIEVGTYPDAVAFCDRAEPRTSIEAKFSLQHAIAATLIDGPPQLAAFEPAGLGRADIAALRRRITVAVSEPYGSAYPRRFGSGLEARYQDGTTVAVAVHDALGDPENPLSRDALIAKAETLIAAAGRDADETRAVIRAALALDQGGAIAGLTHQFTHRDLH
ncbi:MmgE/PrpD family protein [Enterovirga sp.]|uniref:MmgE/PrpD family protein n=1 Tax=Enterovirga sp. TaxID=2026350 RepID=UPI002601DF7C|nr:MmgE/PrpD family protein [Enterovirga sp.]MDB5591920.1 MmgE/PrpD family protein [Enterovirga sp.]